MFCVYSYLGRFKVNSSVTERRVPHTEWLVRPSHSYGLMCYLLRSRGAEKLLDADPLRNLLPADEFITSGNASAFMGERIEPDS